MILWYPLILAIGALLFTFFFGRLISMLDKRKKGHPIQHACLQASVKPLTLFIWFYAIIKIANFISLQFSISPLLTDEAMWIKAAFWIFFSWFLFRWKRNALIHVAFEDKTSKNLLDKVLTITILFITLISLLDVTGQSMATLIAFGGVSGLAIAFASQQVIANFFGGLMIYLTKPFTIGDWILLPEKDVEGHVEEIGWYMTQVLTFDKRPIYIPNSSFSSLLVMTPSRMKHREIKEIIGIRYEDLDKAPVLLKKIKEYLISHPQVDKSLKIITHLDAFSAYAVDLKVQFYTTTTDSFTFQELKQEILFKLASLIHEQKAEMAYPTQVIEVKK